MPIRAPHLNICRDPISFFVAIGHAIGVGAAATGTAAATGVVAAGFTGAALTAGAVAGTGAIVSNSKRSAESASRSASEQIAENKKKTDAQIRSLENQQTLDESGAEETKVRKDAKEKQRRKAASASGRRSTILTSPLGVTGGGSTGDKKTLIGT